MTRNKDTNKGTDDELVSAIKDAASQCCDILGRIGDAAGECDLRQRVRTLTELDSLLNRLKTAKFVYKRLVPPDRDD
jgi:hypothetical protein